MSKRSYPSYYSDKKRPKLDISISDANFPLSQNFATNKDVAASDNWGDENDDEILLLASQACEQACNDNDITSVPDYSMCMQQPYSTSTQYGNPQPSTSKTDFSFKKPSYNQPSSSTANLRDKCNLISSPLHGITPKVVSRLSEDIKISHDLNFNDRIFNDNSTDIIYKQLLQLQEENNKLKSENGKLHEKCVTKEGEASILRTQLKTCQVAIDNARLEKLKAQEKVQSEWTDKINVLNNQMQDLRTQLDFKNLEIISTKEKCKMLESSKIKLTQVTVSNNDINQSHKNNSSYMYPHEPFSRRDKIKMSHSAVQTSCETNFITLHKVPRVEPKYLQSYLPLALQPTHNTLSLLSNEKLQNNTEFTQNKCIIYSTYHRIPDTVNRSVTRCKVSIDSVYEDFSKIVSCVECGKENIVDSYLNIVSKTRQTLLDLNNQLEQMSSRMTMAFKMDMDERYIELTNQYLEFTEKDLISCRPLYKEEQAILPRRLVTMLALTLKNASFNTNLIEHLIKKPENNDDYTFIGVINKICLLFDRTYTSIMYSGFLQSIIFLLHSIHNITKDEKLKTELIELYILIVVSRPLPRVVCEVLGIIKSRADCMKLFCFGNSMGNVKTDLDQGVLLYKKETCPLQVILKVVEVTLKCIERDTMNEQALKVTKDLLLLNSNWKLTRDQDKNGCDCQTVLSQVLVYGLHICASMMECCTDSPLLPALISTCASGISTLYQLVYRDVEMNTRLGHYEGHYQLFVDVCERNRAVVVVNDVYGNMLTELLSTIQSSEDTEMTPNAHQQIWCDSFTQFTIND